jgi:hypothetical protein
MHIFAVRAGLLATKHLVEGGDRFARDAIAVLVDRCFFVMPLLERDAQHARNARDDVARAARLGQVDEPCATAIAVVGGMSDGIAYPFDQPRTADGVIDA